MWCKCSNLAECCHKILLHSWPVDNANKPPCSEPCRPADWGPASPLQNIAVELAPVLLDKCLRWTVSALLNTGDRARTAAASYRRAASSAGAPACRTSLTHSAAVQSRRAWWQSSACRSGRACVPYHSGERFQCPGSPSVAPNSSATAWPRPCVRVALRCVRPGPWQKDAAGR